MKKSHRLLVMGAAAFGVYWFFIRKAAASPVAVAASRGYSWGMDPSGAAICTDAGGRVVVRTLCGEVSP